MRGRTLHRLIIFSIFLILLTIYIPVYSEEGNDVYVIPIKGEINKATYQFVKNRLDEVLTQRPAAIIFNIDTFGGLIDEANNIKEVIMKLDVPTIAFVNTKAESAGVLITIACEKIAMADGATMGSAETIPNTEKVMSLWLSWLRDTSERRGRDPVLISSMADKDIEISGVVKKGELLNINAREAKELGVADIIANNYRDILNNFNIQYNDIVEVETDLRTNAARILTNPYVASILLSLGFIGLLIEVFTAGFGAGGTISLIAFSLFFGGNIIAGNSSWGVLIIFIAGIVLLLIEAAVPGFGIPGIGGLVCVIASIVLAAGSVESAILSLSIAVVLTVIVAVLLIKYGPRSPYLDRIILKTAQNKETGYSGIIIKEDLVNKEGIVVTYLRPSGTVEIEGKRIDAVSEGEFIEKGAKVKVVKVEGPRVVVRKIN